MCRRDAAKSNVELVPFVFVHVAKISIASLRVAISDQGLLCCSSCRCVQEGLVHMHFACRWSKLPKGNVFFVLSLRRISYH